MKMPLARVLRTTQKYLDALKGIGIETVEDLLKYLPRTHEDLSMMSTLCTAPLNEKITIRGTVRNIKRVFTRGRKQLIRAVFIDVDEGHAEVIWFNQPHIMRILKEGDDVVLTGKIIEKGSALQILSPQFEKGGDCPLVHAGRLVPIYPQHNVITTKWLREKMILLKAVIDELPETLPEEIVREEQILSRRDSIRALHFPEGPADVERARDRVAFEAMYRMQEVALAKKKEWQASVQDRLKIFMDTDFIRNFFSSLRFIPTDSQKIAIYEILKDMESGRPMSRLLEGDVGSGKTLVATVVLANVIKNGGQCAFMVPTEVLAKQHTETLQKLLLTTHYKLLTPPVMALLTGSTPASESQRIKSGLANGTIDLVIGTHALIEDDVRFKNLCFVVIDEQHRFGVVQRECLTAKGTPHVLHMTATPIPRTLALTAYGHHDLSVLSEKPRNRPIIHTKVVGLRDRKTVEAFIDRQIEEGRQVFVICPLITHSLPLKGEEKGEGCESGRGCDDRKSVEDEFKRLQTTFPHRRIAMLHGRMLPLEKEKTMRGFKEQRFDVLVSTSVIEVGIDIPNASVMIIEGAERFGLSQLHQFRGRTGRGIHKSYCFLFTSEHASKALQRLRAMEECDDGFKLAEIDLKLRGPGELYGVLQSGVTEGALIHLLNPELVVRARKAVEKHLKSTPSP